MSFRDDIARLIAGPRATEQSLELAAQQVIAEARERRQTQQRVIHVHRQRAIAAGESNRLTADWNSPFTTIDNAIYRQIIQLRARSRERMVNDGFARKMASLYKENVVGPNGFAHQVKLKTRSGNRDRAKNETIEAIWREWGQPENATVTGQMSLRELSQLLWDYLFRDGEYLVRKVRRRSLANGFALQVLEPDALNETRNGRLDTGNIVKMGVEFNAERRPVAYYIRKPSPDLEVYGMATYGTDDDRVPADQILHGFFREYANQTRGIPQLMSVLFELKMLGEFDKAALIASRAGAAKMGFIIDENNEGTKHGADDEDENGNHVEELTPALLEQLEPGLKFQGFDPKYPEGLHEPFQKWMLRRITAGGGTAYNTTSGDLEGVNFSSIRAALLEERDHWMNLQNWFIERFLRPVYKAWLEEAWFTGSLPIGFQEIPVVLASTRFTGKRWSWVNPQQEMEAKRGELKYFLNSPQDAAAELGRDFEDILEQHHEAHKLAKEYGFKLSYDTTTAPKASTPSTAEDQADEGKPTDDDQPAEEPAATSADNS
jgi:lambda family phage portal protein